MVQAGQLTQRVGCQKSARAAPDASLQLTGEACQFLCCCLAPVLKDPIGGERPVPEHPPEQAMAHFLGECGRGDSQHRAPGVGQAVAADLAADHPGQRAATACPHDQQVTKGSDGNQDPACLATLDDGLYWRVSGSIAPCCVKSIPQALTGIFCPDAAQVATRCAPLGEITARWHPGKNRYQSRIMGAGQFLRVAQCPQAAR
jgi:hypothetical protein